MTSLHELVKTSYLNEEVKYFPPQTSSWAVTFKVNERITLTFIAYICEQGLNLHKCTSLEASLIYEDIVFIRSNALAYHAQKGFKTWAFDVESFRYQIRKSNQREKLWQNLQKKSHRFFSF